MTIVLFGKDEEYTDFCLFFRNKSTSWRFNITQSSIDRLKKLHTLHRGSKNSLGQYQFEVMQ